MLVLYRILFGYEMVWKDDLCVDDFCGDNLCESDFCVDDLSVADLSVDDFCVGVLYGFVLIIRFCTLTTGHSHKNNSIIRNNCMLSA